MVYISLKWNLKKILLARVTVTPHVIEMFKKMPAHATQEGDRLWDEALKNNLQPVRGMMKMISTLQSTLCVGSNSSFAHVKWALEKTKLDQFFGARIFSAAQVQNPKPAPDLFLFIAKSLEVKIQDCIVIEDSLSGVQAAQNAGIKVIAFSGAAHFIPSLEQKLKDAEPDWFCSNTDDLERLLKRFELEES